MMVQFPCLARQLTPAKEICRRMRGLFNAAGDMNLSKRRVREPDSHQYGAAWEIDAPVLRITRGAHIGVNALY
jgi:hypothetical protein